jgi:hypothetical protein
MELKIMASLTAFTEVTRDQAITAFGGSGQAAQYCDGQIVIVGGAILLFATLGEGPDQTRLKASDSLEWRPRRNDYHPEEEIPWLPAAAIPRYDRDRKAWATRSHILLQRKAHAGRWLYCGAAHLGSYALGRRTDPPGAGGPASYTLDAGRIPREHWLEFGGYPGWRMMIAGETHELCPHDTARFAELLTALDRPGKVGIDMTRWEGDSLQVMLNDRFGFPMYLRTADDSGLYVRRGNEVDDMEAFACPCCGIPMEYPRHATLPRAEALALICRFFATGVPPEIEGTVALAGGEMARDARWVEQDGI